MSNPKTNEHRNDDPCAKGPDCIKMMLAHDKLGLLKIRYIVIVNAVFIKKNPTHMRVKKSAIDVVRILVSISELMVLTMLRRPFKCGLLKGCCAEEKQQETNPGLCLISDMRKKTMVADRDRHAGSD